MAAVLPSFLFLLSIAATTTSALRFPFFRHNNAPPPPTLPPVAVSPASAPSSSADVDVAPSPSPPDGTLILTPIGRISTIYPLCVGTPRQPSLVPTSRALLRLTLDRGATLDLEHFTHVWLVFSFHLNTVGKKRRLKIAPPSLGGRKVGVLGTRSPHRPNNVGFTLARLLSVSYERGKPVLALEGTDLVDGTPVYDVKPYVPSYDAVVGAGVPEWIGRGIEVRRVVTWKCDRSVSGGLKFYKKGEDEQFLKAVEDTLAADVRSAYHTLKQRGGKSAPPAVVKGGERVDRDLEKEYGDGVCSQQVDVVMVRFRVKEGIPKAGEEWVKGSGGRDIVEILGLEWLNEL